MTGTQVGGIGVLVLATISLVFSAAAWRNGVIDWRNIAGAVGVGLLGIATFVGPRRRILYRILVGTSLILAISTLISRLM
jgi:hypothetical protein